MQSGCLSKQWENGAMIPLVTAETSQHDGHFSGYDGTLSQRLCQTARNRGSVSCTRARTWSVPETSDRCKLHLSDKDEGKDKQIRKTI